MKIRAQQQINGGSINKNYHINLYTHKQNYKHFKPVKGHLKVVFELFLKGKIQLQNWLWSKVTTLFNKMNITIYFVNR